MYKFDALILGAGLAGLSTALRLADHLKVAVISKKTLQTSSSQWAQGGIAASEHAPEIKQHIEDTLEAGAGLSNPDVVKKVIHESQKQIAWLIAQGVDFSKDKHGAYHLTKEGGHRQNRIFHVDDSTGAAIQQTLIAKVRAHQNIHIFENCSVVDLITSHKIKSTQMDNVCLGAYIIDGSNNQISSFSAAQTIIATGGASKVYLYTTNPETSTGDGIAMAWRAGCDIANMEFIQFHPTYLYHPLERSFLISETLRGEGGKLKLPNHEEFMHKYHPLKELAPRDIVARAIDYEMKSHGYDYVFIDITHLDSDYIQQRFPNIYERCKSLNIDITKDPIPVVPAAHYSCGGIKTDLHAETNIHNLYAVGEAASTGLHGANRLASNSLLECLVFSDAATEHIKNKKRGHHQELPEWDESRVRNPEESVLMTHTWNELRRFMWNYVGIVRTNNRLQRALERIEILKREINDFYKHFKVSAEFIEIRNLLQTAELIIVSALKRKESRGLHFSKDYPEPQATANDTILNIKNYMKDDA